MDTKDDNPFTIVSYKNENETIVGYGASLLLPSGTSSYMRHAYVILGEKNLGEFIKNATALAECAGLFYLSGTPSKGMIEMLTGSKWKGVGMMWKDALTDPGYYEYLLGVTSGILLNLPKENIQVHKTVNHTPSFAESSNIKYSYVRNLTLKLGNTPNLKIKNIRYGNDRIVIISRDMVLAKKTAIDLKAQGFKVEILDDAYLNGRKFTIDGKQWNVQEALNDMTDPRKYDIFRNMENKIRPEYIEKIPMGKMNRIWIEEAKNNGYTIIDIGNPLNREFSAFYDIELTIMNWK